MMSEVIAVLCADFHLCHTVPPARAAEPDWYAAMGRPLNQVRELANLHRCPVIAAGDIFDRYNPNPELINWAIDHLPCMCAIPGQHDLPHHNYEDIQKSAYWTLEVADVIDNLGHGKPILVGQVVVHPFPWGFPVVPIEDDKSDRLHLAVIHDYVWLPGASYPGAPDESRLFAYWKRLSGYDTAVFGDNHKGFDAEAISCQVFNSGCLIRRKSDERDYLPAVGLLHPDGKVTRHYLDVSEDKWIDPVDKSDSAEVEGLAEFLAELSKLDADSLDFREATNRWVNDNKVDDDVRRLLFDIMGE